MSSFLESYLRSKTEESRLAFLKKRNSASDSIPIFYSRNLLEMGLSPREKMSVLIATGHESPEVLEDFLTSTFHRWDQNLAAFAIRKWGKETHHLLWHRFLPLARSTHVPQRITYTLLDEVAIHAGKSFVEIFMEKEGNEDFSPAFHALLFLRSLQWNIHSSRLNELAQKYLGLLSSEPLPESKALVPALLWAARHDFKCIKDMAIDASIHENWREILRALIASYELRKFNDKKLQKTLSKGPAEVKLKDLIGIWPPLWNRHGFDAKTLGQCLSVFVRADQRVDWTWLGGIEEETLVEAVSSIDCEMDRVGAASLAYGLIDFVNNEAARELFVDTPMQNLPAWLQLHLGGDGSELATKVLKEREAHGEDQKLRVSDFGSLTSLGYDFELSEFEKGFDAYFGTLYRNEKFDEKISDRYWQLLHNNLTSPAPDALDSLAIEARKVNPLFQLCYIENLGRFQGEDKAALRLLDYVRSKETSELRSVIHALSGIATPRSVQEMISFITRPNTTPDLKLEICALLANHDLTNLQSELRSAFEDINLKTSSFENDLGIREALSDLISDNVEKKLLTDSSKSMPSDNADLDETLQNKIPNYQKLSSEVRRALRTAQFFDNKISETEGLQTIDLSPVIDMQYKALELLFRESFENFAFKVISNGALQRKLDVIGYARPIPKAMDEFEKYIGELPVISSIPYFSKFKLRKMLRAICQFRPGKRFTLDGIKAFALFFLVFGRKKCPYGLEGVIDHGLPDDLTLAEFSKALHVFQDFRNRAAHEGFHPDAQNDISSIWLSTAEIVQTVFFIKGQISSPLEKGAENIHQRKKKAQPQIVRKKGKESA